MSDKVKCSVEGVFYKDGMMGVCSHSKTGGYRFDAELGTF